MNNIKPINNGDKLLNHFLNTTRCLKCKKDYPRKFDFCPFCDAMYGEALEELIADRGDDSAKYEGDYNACKQVEAGCEASDFIQ